MNEALSSKWTGLARGFFGLLILMFTTGFLLNSIYRPERSHNQTVFRPMIETGSWRFLTDFHYWGSATLLVTATILVVGLFLQGFQSRARRMWLPMIATLGLCAGLQVFGNALPMDRHDVQTVNVETSIAARTPLVGQLASNLMLGGSRMAEATIGRWYAISFGLLVALAIVSIWLFVRFRRDGANRLDLLDWILGGLAVAVPVLLAASVPRATGDLFNPEDLTSQSASPSWYVLPMHALLQVFDSISPSLGWIGSAAVPGIVALAAISAPKWAARLRFEARRNIVLAAGGGLAILVATSGTAPAPLSGDQPVHVIESGKSGGPVDSALASRGREAFNKRCYGCHGKDGVGGSGAPPVNAVFKKSTDPRWYMEFIRNPKSKKPGSTMPPLKDIPEEELKALAEWLRSEK